MSFSQLQRAGVALRYRDVGTGLPLLFQHGLGGDEAQVADVMPAFPTLRRITLECRGQGGSPFGPAEELSIATFADDLSTLSDVLNLGPAVVGGISMGAAIAIRLAVCQPQKVRALILARPAWVTEPGPPNMQPYALVGELLQRFDRTEARRRFDASKTAAELARLAPDNLASLSGFFDRAEPKAFGALLAAIAADGPGVTEPDLAALDLPVLVIGHGQDLAHPEATAERLADLIPGAHFVRITPKTVDRNAYRRDFQAALSGFLERDEVRYGRSANRLRAKVEGGRRGRTGGRAEAKPEGFGAKTVGPSGSLWPRARGVEGFRPYDQYDRNPSSSGSHQPERTERPYLTSSRSIAAGLSGVLAVVEIGGTSVKIGFGVDDRPSDFTRTFPTRRIRTADPAAELASVIREASAEAGLSPSAVVATVPGFLDRDFDTVLHARNVPELDGHRLATELSTALGLLVRLERDVVLQLLGEAKAGAVVGETEILAIYIGTGIGAAYLGREGIFRGGGWALEIGHIPMRPASPEDQPQSLEHHASGAALATLAERHGIPVASAFRIDGGPASRAALDRLIQDQALAIVTALALFSPRRLLIGGGVVEMENYPRAALADHIRACLPGGRGVQLPEIVYTRLGWHAAIWGALALDFGADRA